MVLNRNTRSRGGRAVKDARDVIRNKNNQNQRRRGNEAGGSGGGGTRATGGRNRIIKTAQGLVTNKKKLGISTSQLKNRQRDQKARQNTAAPSRRPPADNRSRAIGVGAVIRRSTIVNNNPVLQHALLDIAGALASERMRKDKERRRANLQGPAVNRREVPLNVAASTFHGIVGQQMVQVSERLRERLDQKLDQPCSVLVSNLHPNVSEADINELFRSMGPIVTAMFVSPGNALVTYQRKSDATKAVETYHLRLLDGQPMTCVLLTPDMIPDKQQPLVPGRV